MNSTNKIRHLFTLLIIIVFVIVITITIIGNTSNASIDDFRGVYRIDNDIKISVLTNLSGNKKAPFYIYSSTEDNCTVSKKGFSISSSLENCLTLYNANKSVFGEIIYTNGNYYYIRNQMEPKKIYKEDSYPIIPEK